MSKTHYAILRVDRLKSRADLDGATRHGRRDDTSTHFDPERTPHNLHWGAGRVVGPVDWAEAVECTIKRFGASVRKGAPLAAEFLVGASPEYFDAADAHSHFDMDRVMAWAEATLAAFHERYPRMVCAARLDLDEGSPHMAICVVPIYTKKTKHTERPAVSYRRVFGGETLGEARDKMIALQDWYAAKMAPLGLKRGLPKSVTGRGHQSHQEYARRRILDDQAREQARIKAEQYVKELRDQVNEMEERLVELKVKEDETLKRLSEVTRVLFEAEKAHAWLTKFTAALIKYDPNAPVSAVLLEKQNAMDINAEWLARLRGQLVNLDEADASPKPM